MSTEPKPYENKSLGNFGVYKSIFNGIGDFKGFHVKDEEGNLYEVGGIEITYDKGVVLSVFKDTHHKDMEEIV